MSTRSGGRSDRRPWASFVVNDVSRQIDSREAPASWPYGIFVIGAHEPNVMPPKPMSNDLYELNGKLAHWAFLQTRAVKIPDNEAMRKEQGRLARISQCRNRSAGV